MGLFDRVLAEYPHCNREVELQSKAGDCILNSYSINQVPVAIAVDLKSNYICSGCSGKYTFHSDASEYVKCELISIR